MSKSKISIFHLEHWGGIAQAITLRTRLHREDFAILVVGDYGSKKDICEKMVSEGVFDQLVFYNTNDFIKITDEAEVEQAIHCYFERSFKDVNVNDINRIYTSCDLHNSFAIYLAQKEWRYTYFEFCVATYSRTIVNEAFKLDICSEAYNEIMNKYAVLYGFSPLCDKFFIYGESVDNCHMDGSKVERYDFNKELMNIDVDYRNKIVSAFSIQNFEEKCQLVLTNSGGFMKSSGLSDEKLPLLIQYLLDFTDGITKPVIKRHPYDTIDYSSFENTVVASDFPIELLNLTEGMKNITEVVSMYTTSIGKLSFSENCKNCDWGANYFKLHGMLPKLYAMASLIDSVQENYPYHVILDQPDFVKRFYSMSKFNVGEIKGADPLRIGKVVLLVDSVTREDLKDISQGLRAADDESIVCFVNNVRNIFDYKLDDDIIYNIIPIKINISKLEGSLYEGQETEYIYIYSKSSLIRDNIKKFAMDENFIYSKIRISVRGGSACNDSIADFRFKYCQESFKKLNDNILNLRKRDVSNSVSIFNARKKFKVVLYFDDWHLDMALSYLRGFLCSEQIEIIGIATQKLNAFKKCLNFEVLPISYVLKQEYDYVIACDFTDDCLLKNELVEMGINRNKIIKGKILENPCFDFEKYHRVHNIPGGVTIISEHCFGGMIYNDLDMEFRSPLINLWIPHEDFFRMIENLEYYLKLPVEYYGQGDVRDYPIGILGDVLIHFNHYSTFEEAKAAWEKRVKRVNLNNIFVELPLFSQEHIECFKKIKYRKLGLSFVKSDDNNIENSIIDMYEYGDEKIKNIVKHFYQFALDTISKNTIKKFPRMFDSYKLLLGDEDYLLK